MMYEEYEDEEEGYTPPIPKLRANATVGRDTTFYEQDTKQRRVVQAPPKRHKQPPHVLFFVGVGMLIFLAIWMGWTLVFIPWWNSVTTHWEYGNPSSPHVSELTVNVGHGGTSTILAFDNADQLTIVELVNGKAVVYTGGSFLGGDKDNRIITLSLDSTQRKPNLVIHVVGMEGAFILYNTGAQFSWTSH